MPPVDRVPYAARRGGLDGEVWNRNVEPGMPDDIFVFVVWAFRCDFGDLAGRRLVDIPEMAKKISVHSYDLVIRLTYVHT